MNSQIRLTEKIIRRDVKIPLHQAQKYQFYEDNQVVTTVFAIMSAMFPPGELFFIESIRNVRDQIKDEVLQQQIRNFIAQEAFHSREHKALNSYLVNAGYPEVMEIEAKTKARLDRLRRLSMVEQLAATVVMEHFTATLATLLLTDRLIHSRTTQPSRNLWEWHALEELEHKSVAFDVLNAIGGNTQANRVKALARVTYLIIPILGQYWAKVLARKDIRFSGRHLAEAVYLSVGGYRRLGIFSRAGIEMLDVVSSNFNPRHMHTEQLEAEYREKLFGENGILNNHTKRLPV